MLYFFLDSGSFSINSSIFFCGRMPMITSTALGASFNISQSNAEYGSEFSNDSQIESLLRSFLESGDFTPYAKRRNILNVLSASAIDGVSPISLRISEIDFSATNSSSVNSIMLMLRYTTSLSVFPSRFSYTTVFLIM